MAISFSLYDIVILSIISLICVPSFLIRNFSPLEFGFVMGKDTNYGWYGLIIGSLISGFLTWQYVSWKIIPEANKKVVEETVKIAQQMAVPIQSSPAEGFTSRKKYNK
jgi:hypothetical protein